MVFLTMSEPVDLPAQIIKIQTMSSGLVRFTIDAQEGKILETAQMMVFLAEGGAGILRWIPGEVERWDDEDWGEDDA